MTDAETISRAGKEIGSYEEIKRCFLYRCELQ